MATVTFLLVSFCGRGRAYERRRILGSIGLTVQMLTEPRFIRVADTKNPVQFGVIKQTPL